MAIAKRRRGTLVLAASSTHTGVAGQSGRETDGCGRAHAVLVVSQRRAAAGMVPRAGDTDVAAGEMAASRPLPFTVGGSPQPQRHSERQTRSKG